VEKEENKMPDVFTPVIERLQEIGAFNFLFPYILTSAIFYGLLRKSQIFGKPEENVAVNGVVALVAGFMILAYPILSGVSIEGLLPAFFMQGLVVLLVFMVVLMIMGMFLPPDLPKVLSEGLLQGNKALGILVVGVIFGFLILFLSGLSDVLLGKQVIGELSPDIINIVVIILLLVVPIVLITWSGKPPTPTAPPKTEERVKT